MSLAPYGYTLPDSETRRESGIYEWPLSMAARDIAVITTEHLAIAAFTIPLKLQQRAHALDGHGHELSDAIAADSRIIRLVAFDLLTGQYEWQREVQACESRPDPFLWTVRGIGYAVRAPWSIDVYSESGELLHRTPLPGVPLERADESNAGFPAEATSVQGVSPSGRTALIVNPRFSDPENPAPRLLTAVDVLGGNLLATIRAPLGSASTGDGAMAFAVSAPPVGSKPCCTTPLGVKAWGKKTILRNAYTAMTVEPFVSDSRFLALRNTGNRSRGVVWSLLLVDTKGIVTKSLELPYFHPAFWYVSFAGAANGLFALSLTSDDAHYRQSISVYDANTLHEMDILQLDGDGVVRAKAALTADGSAVAVFDNENISIYELLAGRKP